MLSYESVKLLHIVTVMMMVGFGTVHLLDQNKRISIVILQGLAGVAAFLAGGLLIGIIKQGMPLWLHFKIIVWLLLMVMVGIVPKRFPLLKIPAVVVLYSLAALSVYFAIYKPFV